MAYEDLLIGGTSLKTYGKITDFSGILASGPLRGENVTYPGLAGDVFVPKVRGAYVFTVPMVLYGSLATINTALDNLRTLLNSSSAALAMTRHRTTGAGNVSETASGEFVGGLEPGLVGLTAGRISLDIVNLSGAWS
jgi:hypothetical protein